MLQIFFALGILRSPRWLVIKGRRYEAAQTLP